MTQKMLIESGARLREASTGKWRVTLITPGIGSSATYTDEVLDRDAATAFPAGTKLWFGHPKEWEGPGDRDARDQWARLDAPAYFTPGTGIEADVTLKRHWQEVVESLGEDAELSVYVLAHVDEENVVTHLLPERTNSIDIVSYAGRPGSGLKQKIESARAASPQAPDAASAQVHQKEEGSMDKEILEALTALKAAFADFVTESKAAAPKPVAEAEADADAIDKAVKEAVKPAVEAYAAAEKAIADAKLLPSQAESLRAAALDGKDVAPLIEEAKKVVDEFKALSESAPHTYGRVVEGASNDDWEVSL